MITLRKFIYSWYISVAHIKSLFKRPSNRSIYIPQGSNQFTLKGTLLSTLVYNSKSTAVLAYFLYNLEIFALLHVKVTILVAFNNAFKAYNSERIWSHFSASSAFTKSTCYTPGCAEVTRAFKNLLLIFNTSYKNHEFENRTFDWIRLYNFLCEFDCVQFTVPGEIRL